MAMDSSHASKLPRSTARDTARIAKDTASVWWGRGSSGGCSATEVTACPANRISGASRGASAFPDSAVGTGRRRRQKYSGPGRGATGRRVRDNFTELACAAAAAERRRRGKARGSMAWRPDMSRERASELSRRRRVDGETLWASAATASVPATLPHSRQRQRASCANFPSRSVSSPATPMRTWAAGRIRMGRNCARAGSAGKDAGAPSDTTSACTDHCDGTWPESRQDTCRRTGMRRVAATATSTGGSRGAVACGLQQPTPPPAGATLAWGCAGTRCAAAAAGRGKSAATVTSATLRRRMGVPLSLWRAQPPSPTTASICRGQGEGTE